MRKTFLRCAQCESTLVAPTTTGSGVLTCPVCRSASRAWLFPALFQRPESETGQRILEEGQSSCMNHPEKQAVAVCDGCGKFLCALCDVDWGGEHLCTACIQHRKHSNHEGAYRSVYIHYDSVALGIVLLSLVLMPFGGLGGLIAPAAIYVAWRHWRAPLRPAPHGKWTMMVAVLLANLIFVSWLGFVVYFLVNLL
jgi:hypothetical protein